MMEYYALYAENKITICQKKIWRKVESENGRFDDMRGDQIFIFIIRGYPITKHVNKVKSNTRNKSQ